jgi:hypothetical protein
MKYTKQNESREKLERDINNYVEEHKTPFHKALLDTLKRYGKNKIKTEAYYCGKKDNGIEEAAYSLEKKIRNVEIGYYRHINFKGDLSNAEFEEKVFAKRRYPDGSSSESSMDINYSNWYAQLKRIKNEYLYKKPRFEDPELSEAYLMGEILSNSM